MIYVCYTCHTAFTGTKYNYTTDGGTVYVICPACQRRMNANLQERSSVQQVIGFRDAQ